MSILTSGKGSGALSPQEISTLLIEPVFDGSTIGQVSTTILAQGSSLRVPKVSDGGNAGFIAEGAEINVSEATIAELVAEWKNLSALSAVTNQMVADSDSVAGGVLTIVGNSLTRDLAAKLDLAAFGNTTSNGPKGIQSVTGVHDLGTDALTNTDSVQDGVSAIRSAGNNAALVVTTPALAAHLAKLKVATASNVPLLGANASAPVASTIAGLPLLTSSAVKPDSLYVLDPSRIILAVRQDAEIETDSSVFFSSARTAVRATLRVDILWTDPAAIAVVTFDDTP